MGITATEAFALVDLAVFDGPHLREVISSVSGAVSPAMAGRAFASASPAGPPLAELPMVGLADRIERALPPDDRATFG